MEAITKPAVLSGVMELLPEEQLQFEYILSVIRKHFALHAFYPLDTTILEKSEVLLAKGGGETEKQIYRFEKGSNDISMRFDLTVPLARFVAQHFSELEFPFRRYQIGKVYRGERKQKGRYREFYQCDVDIIGHNKLHLLNDAQIPAVMDAIFMELGLPPYAFYINHRGILSAYMDDLSVEDPVQALRILDKLKKMGKEKVEEEFAAAGLDEAQIEKLLALTLSTGSNDEVLKYLGGLSDSEAYQAGVSTLREVYEGMMALGIDESRIRIDPTITRGLDYYTGTVYETFILGHEEIGSICSGGRYENLASYYTTQQLPGVGMSIGLTRLFSKLQEGGLVTFPPLQVAQAAIISFPGSETYALKLSEQLRKGGIPTLLQIEQGKIGKKLQTIDKQKIPYAIMVGDDEVQTETATVKNLESGEQQTLSIDELVNLLRDK